MVIGTSFIEHAQGLRGFKGKFTINASTVIFYPRKVDPLKVPATFADNPLANSISAKLCGRPWNLPLQIVGFFVSSRNWRTVFLLNEGCSNVNILNED